MVPLEVALLGTSVLAFVAVLWLLAGRDRSVQAGFSALADREGWNYQTTPPPELLALVGANMGATTGTVPRTFLSGPTPAGPFQLVTFVPAEGKTGVVPRSFLHVRVPTASPGLRIVPAHRFRFAPAHGSSDGSTTTFQRRFDVEGNDPQFTARALGVDACMWLARPKGSLSVSWLGKDLIVTFPLVPSTPEGHAHLVRHGTELALRMLTDAPSRTERVTGNGLRQRVIARRPMVHVS